MSATPTPAETATATVAQMRDLVEWLAVSLMPGTHKPFVPQQMSAEKRAEVDARNRVILGTGRQIGTTVMVPLGESPAPMDLDVMDLLVDALTTADELADIVSDTAKVARMPSAPTAFADPVPYLIHVTDLIPACHHDTAALVLIARRCETVVFRARSMLGLITDGQLLPLMCPWCGGRTSKHPVGGAKTLRVRLMPVVNNKTGADEEIPVVVCEAGQCEPGDENYGTVWRGRPAWPLDTEGQWLNEQITIAAKRRGEEEQAVNEIVGIAS